MERRVNFVLRGKLELIRDRVDLFSDGEWTDVSGTKPLAG